MLTAKDARARIDSLDTARGRHEKQMVEERINKAVERGEGSCWLNAWISKATEEWLTSLGYTVERIYDQRDGDDVKVTW